MNYPIRQFKRKADFFDSTEDIHRIINKIQFVFIIIFVCIHKIGHFSSFSIKAIASFLALV